jgi:steroid 5-alpha reductase family enzyme
MSLIVTVISGFAIVAAALVIVWAIQLGTRNAGLVDAVWSWCLGFLGVWYAAYGSAPAQLRLVLGLLAGVWGLRLGLHLFLRHLGQPEDGRYRRFRNEWGANANKNMFWFFQFQGLMALLLSVGFIVVANRSEAPGPAQVMLAILIWLASVIGEGLADWQLEQFKKDPANRGRVCARGLWRYSRHPNYFFECLHWVAYLPLAYGAGFGFIVALIPPFVMAWLLLKLSGIPITEAHLATSRPGYADYIRTTSVFIPWPPKRH